MNRKLFLLVIVLLAAVLLPARWAAAETVAFDAAESEPNDTIAQADPITIGDTTAVISVEGDVDYFRLSLSAGQRVYLAALADCGGPLRANLAVFNHAGTLLAEGYWWPDNNIVFEFVAPSTGYYYVRVQSGGTWGEELTGSYTLLARILPDDEPNGTYESATPIEWGADITSTFMAPNDLDYYRIHARAGDVIVVSLSVDEISPEPRWAPYIYIDNEENIYPYQGGASMQGLGPLQVQYVVPFDGDYMIRPGSVLDHCGGLDFPQAYHMTVKRQSLHVAARRAGNVDAVPFGPNDILTPDETGQWRMVFDGEDVGLTAPLGGFEFLDDGSILLSLSSAQSLPGLGKVRPQDIVRFVPTQLGAATQGAFQFYLVGAQAGLTTLGERIDAITTLEGGELLISTTGSASVPKLGGGSNVVRNEDILRFHPSGAMPSAGNWSMNLDGSAFFPKFSDVDMEALTLYQDDYEADNLQWFNSSALFILDKSYRYSAYVEGGPRNFTAAPGDLLPVHYQEYRHSEHWIDRWVDYWPPIKRATFGHFPVVITSLSIGPAWTP